MARQTRSFIYRHVFIYRVVLTLLYGGRYRRRFDRVLELLDPSVDTKVLELCFGDIYIADWCRKRGVEYLGIDANPHFVKRARAKGYNVILADLRELPPIGESDVVVIIGSLYHFHDMLGALVEWAMASSRRLVVSEPIRNWASRKGVWGRIASILANAGRGPEEFRYDEQSLREALIEVSDARYHLDFSVSGKEAIAQLRPQSVPSVKTS